MKKVAHITLIVTIIISFLMTISSAVQSEDRSKGQCSYHGGLDKDTGKCKDGTLPGAVTPASTCKKGDTSCEKPKKPVPASYIKGHDSVVSKIEALSDKKELCETDKCLAKIDKQLMAAYKSVDKWCAKIHQYDPDYVCGMQGLYPPDDTDDNE